MPFNHPSVRCLSVVLGLEGGGGTAAGSVLIHPSATATVAVPIKKKKKNEAADKVQLTFVSSREEKKKCIKKEEGETLADQRAQLQCERARRRSDSSVNVSVL